MGGEAACSQPARVAERRQSGCERWPPAGAVPTANPEPSYLHDISCRKPYHPAHENSVDPFRAKPLTNAYAEVSRDPLPHVTQHYSPKTVIQNKPHTLPPA